MVECVKLAILIELLEKIPYKTVIIFVNTLRFGTLANACLKENRFNAHYMSSKLDTTKRDSLFTKFRNGAINLLIATNLAERGIDLPIVNTVINLEVPWSRAEAGASLSVDPTIYLHRVGRTGRIGRQGVAMTFVVSDNDREAL